MNEQDKELALRIMREAGHPMDDGELNDGEIDLVVSMFNLFHADKLEQYGKGFDEAYAKYKTLIFPAVADIQREPKWFYQAGAASREAEVVALKEEVSQANHQCSTVIEDTANELGCAPDNEVILQAIASLKKEVERLKEDNRSYVSDNANLVGRLVTAQADAKKLRDKAQTLLTGWAAGFNYAKMEPLIQDLREALSTPINTTEIDALVKDAERWRKFEVCAKDLVFTKHKTDPAKDHWWFNSGNSLNYIYHTPAEAIDAASKESGATK